MNRLQFIRVAVTLGIIDIANPGGAIPADLVEQVQHRLAGEPPSPPVAAGPWQAVHPAGKTCGHSHTKLEKAGACASRLGDGWVVESL